MINSINNSGVNINDAEEETRVTGVTSGKQNDYVACGRWGEESEVGEHQINTTGSFTSGRGWLTGIGITLSPRTDEQLDKDKKQPLSHHVQQLKQDRDPKEGENNEVILLTASARRLQRASRLWLRAKQHPAQKSSWREEMELGRMGQRTGEERSAQRETPASSQAKISYSQH